jgi:hypothetical protein
VFDAGIVPVWSEETSLILRSSCADPALILRSSCARGSGSGRGRLLQGFWTIRPALPGTVSPHLSVTGEAVKNPDKVSTHKRGLPLGTIAAQNSLIQEGIAGLGQCSLSFRLVYIAVGAANEP